MICQLNENDRLLTPTIQMIYMKADILVISEDVCSHLIGVLIYILSLRASLWYFDANDIDDPRIHLKFVYARLGNDFTPAHVKYVLKRVSFGSKDCTKELKPEFAYFLGQTS